MYFPRKWVWKYINTFFIESFEPQVGRFVPWLKSPWVQGEWHFHFIHSDKTFSNCVSVWARPAGFAREVWDRRYWRCLKIPQNYCLNIKLNCLEQNNKRTSPAGVASTAKQPLDVARWAWLHCVDSSTVTFVHKPLTPIVSYLLLFCMVCLELAQDAERADWCEDPTVLSSLVLLADRRVTVITLHGAQRLRPLRHTCDRSLRGTRSCRFKATKHREILGRNICTERQTNTCLCF